MYFPTFGSIFVPMLEQLDHAYRIGHRIRKLRELKNLTQEHIAHELGMSVSGYGRIERDEVRLDSDKLMKVSEVLGVPVEEILRFDEKLVFQNYGGQNTNNGYNWGANHIGEMERLEKLYREQIDLLKDEVRFLREELRKR